MCVFILALVTLPSDHILLTGTLPSDLVAVNGRRPILVAVTWVAAVASDWSIVVLLAVARPIRLVAFGVKPELVGTVTRATDRETIPAVLTGLSGHLLTVPPSLELTTLTGVAWGWGWLVGWAVTDSGILTGVVVPANVLTFWAKGSCNFIELCTVIAISIKSVMLYFNKNITPPPKKGRLSLLIFLKMWSFNSYMYYN